MDIEIIATSTIEKLISRNSYLKTYIESNDKTPIWDGYVFVYRNKNRNKKNEDLIGKVPVQVKGHESEVIENDKIKFRIDLESIKKFYTDGGVIFFVVYITPNSEKIYYNSLLPLDLKRLIKKYNQQKTLEIELKTLPTEEKELADIFLDFIQNRKEQSGTLIDEFLYINDTQNIQNEIKQFKFSYSTVEPEKSIPFKELTTRDIYLYMEPKGIGNPIPVEKFSNAIVNIEHELEISVRGRIYYHDAYVQWQNGVPSVRCGKGIRIFIPYAERAGYHNINLKIDFTGTLNEILHDLCFIRDMIESKEFSINKSAVPFENYNLEDKEDFYKRINNLELLKQRLEYYGVKTDLNLDKITDEDNIKLAIIMQEYPSIEKYKIDLSESPILKVKVANILIILIAEEDIEKKYYKFKDFFTSNLMATYMLKEGIEYIPMSQFLILDKEGLSADNIDAEKILDDIKKKS